MSEFLGIEADIPFAPAMGVINGPNIDSIVEQTRQILRSPLLFSRWGSITYYGGEGNEPKYGRVYYHNQLTGQTINSIGLPSVSIEVMERVYPDLQKEAVDRGKAIIPGISTTVGEDPFDMLPEMAERLVDAGAERIEVDYSCPNSVTEFGDREPILSNDIDRMKEVDEAIVARIGLDIWLLRKISPPVGDMKPLIDSHLWYFSEVAGKVALTFNSIADQSILTELGDPALDVPKNVGGLSGPATRAVGRKLLETYREALPDTIQLDSSLGVDNGGEVFIRADELGANFSSGVTVYLQNEEAGINFERTSRYIANQYYRAKEAALTI